MRTKESNQNERATEHKEMKRWKNKLDPLKYTHEGKKKIPLGFEKRWNKEKKIDPYTYIHEKSRELYKLL